MEIKKNSLPERGKTVVNITKKRSVTIDKHGNIVNEADTSDKKKIAEARAKKLGFK